ncbi:hypothetical protein CPB85DRAFT_287852 [Mucidula mucida]|nr:hypothetical protein CPB85DRAFT_287852 [Mucidula mucida]
MIRRVIRRMEQQERKRPSATPRPRQVTPPRPPTKVEATMDIDNEAFSPTHVPTTPIRATTRAPSRQCPTPPPSQAFRNVHIGDPDQDGWTEEDYQSAYLHTKKLLIAQENINTELGEQKRRFYADWKDNQAANEIRIATLENNNSALTDEIEMLKRTNQDLREEVKSVKQEMVDKDNVARNEKLHYTENTLNAQEVSPDAHAKR